MLALTTPESIPNITRMKVARAAPLDPDIDTALEVTVYAMCPPVSQTPAVQIAKAYGGAQVLRIRNTTSDALGFSSDATVNPYTSLLVRRAITTTGLMDTCVAAMVAAGNSVAAQLRAVETALAAAGVLPAGSVA